MILFAALFVVALICAQIGAEMLLLGAVHSGWHAIPALGFHTLLAIHALLFIATGGYARLVKEVKN